MRSTLFMRAKTRRVPPPETAASSQRKSKDNETPASVDDHEIYFDNTPPPRRPVKKSQSADDEGSRPPPTNPEAASLASSSFGLPRRAVRGRASTAQRSSSPPLRRTSTVPPKINVSTFWSANEELERKYDLTPVGNEQEGGNGLNSFVVDPWEHEGSRPSTRR